jgi:peptide-methionine (S)-S-oxide reductase
MKYLLLAKTIFMKNINVFWPILGEQAARYFVPFNYRGNQIMKTKGALGPVYNVANPQTGPGIAVRRFVLLTLLSLAAVIGVSSTHAAETAVKIPAAKMDAAMTGGTNEATAILAGGCFWGVQAVFQHTQGVIAAVSGYAGGDQKTAHYEDVSSGSTGHAETVKITYDPHKISYGKLLQIYFSVVQDPTQLNRQGPDSGTQYRSAIFYQDDEQKRIATSYIAQLDAEKVFPKPIVTQVVALPATSFYAAEKYHQDFATLHPQHGYIAFYDLPKLENLKKLFPAEYRPVAVTVNKL